MVIFRDFACKLLSEDAWTSWCHWIVAGLYDRFTRVTVCGHSASVDHWTLHSECKRSSWYVVSDKKQKQDQSSVTQDTVGTLLATGVHLQKHHNAALSTRLNKADSSERTSLASKL